MNSLIRYERLLDELFRPAVTLRTDAAAAVRPIRVDVKETAEAYILAAELPGVRKDEIQVEIDGDEVTIAAETQREESKEGEQWLRVERRHGKSIRRFALPQAVDEAKVEARFVNGVLELTLPKKAPATVRKVEIH